MRHRDRVAGCPRAWVPAVLLALAVAGCSGSVSSATSAAPSTAAAGSPASAAGGAANPANWPTYHGDPAHSGVSASMPAVAGAPQIIKKAKLDGQVYASPIAVNGVIVVATENDSIYGSEVLVPTTGGVVFVQA
jgi:hypothetical protein